MPSSPKSLYVHIPFCDHLCAYCDFCKVLYRPSWAEDYLTALDRELFFYSSHRFDTIYLGGGTPSCLPLPQLCHVLTSCSLLLSSHPEFTLEANPESFDLEKAKACAKHGVNRISFGVQSSQDKFLDLLGRKHTFDEAKKAVEIARSAGIDDINVDLMYALPGETMEDLEKDIDAFLSLNVPHISTYSLILEEGTAFHNQEIKEASEDLQADMYERILFRLRNAGYRRYEVSNFAKPGLESRHNQTYWKDQEYVGIGLGASGYENGIRYTKQKNLTAYLKNPTLRKEEEKVSLKEDRSYYLLCNLRLEEGFSLGEFENRFSIDFFSCYPSARKKISEGLLKKDGGRIACTDKGMLLMDAVLVDLSMDEESVSC